MKCIQSKATAEVSRVGNEEAHKLVADNTHRYVPKSVWKQAVRDAALHEKWSEALTPEGQRQ